MTTTFERRLTILRLLKEQPGIKVTDMSELLDVSLGTVRNDLNALQKEGKVNRVRGGAVLAERQIEQEAPADEIVNRAAKERIARRAAEMVKDGDAIWLDAGTTVQLLIPLLQDRKQLTIVTNGLRAAVALSEQSEHTVLLLGGRLGIDGIYTISMGRSELLDSINIQTAFVSGVGFSTDAGLTVLEFEDAQIKSQVIESAENVVAMVDATKIGRRGFAPVANIQQITHFLTDQDLSEGMLRELRNGHVNVTVCGQNTIRSHTIATGKQKYVIGFANQSENLPFAVDVRKGLERAVSARGDVDLVLTDNKLSSAEALRVANHLIQREVDLAIEYQIDHRGGNLIIDKFQRARIPVIAVDIPMIGATFFGVDNYRAGYMAGEALGKWVKQHWSGNIDHLVILEEPRAGDLPKARIHGQQDAFETILGEVPSDKTVFLDSGNTHSTSRQNMTRWFKKIPGGSKIATICFNDEAAVGAIRAARELGRETEIVVVGQGADRMGRTEILRPNSRLIGSTAYMPEKYGEMLIEIALRLLKGAPVPPAVYIDHIFLTAETLGHYYQS